ncbi:MAG: hypothetical protein WBA46_15880, partial [Thermomicrobiales bacterium]
GVHVEFTTGTDTVSAGTPAHLAFRIVDDATGESVTDLPVSHEKPMHLILVSGDLQQFQHIHPTLQADGTWAVEATLPTEGTWVLYNEFIRGDHTVLDQRQLVVGTASTVGTTLTPDTAPQTVDGLTLSLGVPDRIVAGQEVELTLAASKDGQPVTTLQPYLAAAAHVAIVGADTTNFAHTHAEVATAGGDHATGDHALPATFGPDLVVHHTFEQAGTYKIWVQVNDNGEVITIPFVIEVQ